jgi:hypothetical protein
LPLVIVRGAQAGPKVVIAAAQHGDEGYAVLGALRLIEQTDVNQLRGDLWILPCLNVDGYISGQRNSPFDQQDMNRVHPGSETGNLTQQIAAVLHRFILPGSDLLIDLHGGSPDVGDIAFGRYADAPGKASLELLADSLPLTFLLDPSAASAPGMWSTATPTISVPHLSIEAGSALNTAAENAEEWVSIVHTALRVLNMLPGEVQRRHLPVVTTSSHPASSGGAFVSFVRLGERVSQGQSLGQIQNLLGEVVQSIHSKAAGTVAVLRTGVRVHPGQSLVTVATEV